jgi:hypothetical protein
MLGRIPVTICSKCGTWIGTKRYNGSHALCIECARERQRRYDKTRQSSGSRRIYHPRRFPGDGVRRKPGPQPKPLTDAEILEGAKIGKRLKILHMDVWSMVDLATFGPEAWKMPTERDEEDSYAIM